MLIFVNLRMSVDDRIVDYCIADLLQSGVKPSRITVGAIRKRAADCYRMYGMQADSGTADEAGFDLEDDLDDDTWGVIQAVRQRLGV